MKGEISGCSDGSVKDLLFCVKKKIQKKKKNDFQTVYSLDLEANSGLCKPRTVLVKLNACNRCRHGRTDESKMLVPHRELTC